MRLTEHTPKSEVLEYQPEEVIQQMDRQFHSMWKNLYDHQGEYQDAKWFKRNRTKRLIPDTRLCYIYTAPGYEDYYLELIPKSLSVYTKSGLRSDDVVVIWFSEYEFIAITVYDFDTMYNNLVEKDETIDIKKMMMEKLGGMIERATTGK